MAEDDRDAKPDANPLVRNTLNAKDWYLQALVMLADQGAKNLSIKAIARRLQITYGSFYYHFDSADAFYRGLLNYWHCEVLVKTAQEHLNSPDPSLESLMVTLTERGMPAYDIAIRDWAKSYPPAAKAIKKADAYRMKVSKLSFEKRGIDSANATVRGDMVVTMHLGNLQHPDPKSRAENYREFIRLIDNLQ